jgi:hypothetical protein
LGVFTTEHLYVFGAVLAFKCLAEDKSVSDNGDNLQGKINKEEPEKPGIRLLGP